MRMYTIEGAGAESRAYSGERRLVLFCGVESHKLGSLARLRIEPRVWFLATR